MWVYPARTREISNATCRALSDQIWRFAPYKSATVRFCEHLRFKKRNCSSKSATVHLQSLRKSCNLEIISKKSACKCDSSSLGPGTPKSVKTRLSPYLNKKSSASWGASFLCERGKHTHTKLPIKNCASRRISARVAIPSGSHLRSS